MQSDFSVYDYIDFVRQIEHHQNQQALGGLSASDRNNSKLLNPENKNIKINIPNATCLKQQI